MVVLDNEMKFLRGTEDLNEVFFSLQLTGFVPGDISGSKSKGASGEIFLES